MRTFAQSMPLDAASTTDFYELCVERHQKAATIVTSNRTPDEWMMMMMADPLLAQSAVDRLVSTAHELIIEGPSYQQRQKPSLNRHATGVSVDDQKGHQP
jgi:DNA replication protein DnaC